MNCCAWFNTKGSIAPIFVRIFRHSRAYSSKSSNSSASASRPKTRTLLCSDAACIIAPLAPALDHGRCARPMFDFPKGPEYVCPGCRMVGQNLDEHSLHLCPLRRDEEVILRDADTTLGELASQLSHFAQNLDDSRRQR